MNETIHQNRLPDQRQMIVVLEFLDDTPTLEILKELFDLFQGKEIECTSTTLSFGAMYAVELADVLVGIEKIFPDYYKGFGLVQTGNALRIRIESM